MTSPGVSSMGSGLSTRGNSMLKRLPSPRVLATVKLPPISSTRLLLSVSPRPEPSTPLCSAPSRSNGTNSRGSLSAGMPGPVSLTVSRSRAGPAASQDSRTSPCSRLYLTALESRFKRTCLSFWLCACTQDLPAPSRYPMFRPALHRNQRTMDRAVLHLVQNPRLNSPDVLLRIQGGVQHLAIAEPLGPLE